MHVLQAQHSARAVHSDLVNLPGIDVADCICQRDNARDLVTVVNSACEVFTLLLQGCVMQ